MIENVFTPEPDRDDEVFGNHQRTREAVPKGSEAVSSVEFDSLCASVVSEAGTESHSVHDF